MSWPASSHDMFFQQFFITVRTFNPLIPHHFTIYPFCLTGLDFLAWLDWSLWQKLLISYPIFIWHLHYYKLWFCSGWHHAKRNKCSHFWAFFAVKYAHVSQFCPVGTEWQSPGVGSRGHFAFLMKRYSNNWHAPSPLPLSLSPEHSHDTWSFSKHLAATSWQAQEQKATFWRRLGHRGGKGLGSRGFPEPRIFSWIYDCPI